MQKIMLKLLPLSIVFLFNCQMKPSPSPQTESVFDTAKLTSLEEDNADADLLLDSDDNELQDPWVYNHDGPKLAFYPEVCEEWKRFEGLKSMEFPDEERKEIAENAKKLGFELDEAGVEFPVCRRALIKPQMRNKELEHLYLVQYKESIYPYLLASPRDDILVMMQTKHVNKTLCKLDVLQKQNGTWTRKKRFHLDVSNPKKIPAKILLASDTVNIFSDGYMKNLGHIELSPVTPNVNNAGATK